MNHPLLDSDFSSVASWPLSAFIELKRVKALLWIRLWLKGISWLVWSSIQTTKTFSLTARRLFCFLIIHVFTGIALLISFKNVYMHNLCTRLSFQPILIFNRASSRILVISSFWFKVRNVWLFLSLRGHCRVIYWPNLNIDMSQGIGRPEERKRKWNGWMVEQSEHTRHLSVKFSALCWCSL